MMTQLHLLLPSPTVDIIPPFAASNAELPALGLPNGRSDLQTQSVLPVAGLSDYQQDFDRIIS